jgi:hypothetical protein
MAKAMDSLARRAPMGLYQVSLMENPYRSRPCEERSDEAIQGQPSGFGLLRLRLAMTAGATAFWAANV